MLEALLSSILAPVRSRIYSIARSESALRVTLYNRIGLARDLSPR